MRLLIITNQFPLPLDMGGPVRILGLMQALAEEHELHVLALRRRATGDALAEELARLLDAPVETFAPSAPSRSPLAAVSRWGDALRRGIPPWVLAELNPDLGRRAAALAPGVSAVVLLDDYAGVYARQLSGIAPIVADKHNVAGWSARSGGLDGPAALPDALRHLLATHLTRRCERRVARDVQAIVVTSGRERDRFRDLYGREPEAVVPSAVTLGRSRRSPRGRARCIGWLGTHDYAANVEGLVRFVEEGWRVLGEHGLELLIAGSNPTPRVRALERHPGVRVLGYVEHLAGFLDELEAAVIPLWQGAGVKVKTLTLMGAGIPVVGTPVALEGMDVEHGTHCLIADDPSELAAELERVLGDALLAARLSAEGRRLIETQYSWDSVGPRFVEVVQRAANLPRADAL